MAEGQKSRGNDSPISVGLMIIGLVCGFATVLWFASRPQVAFLYGYIRGIEFPLINRVIPHAQEFTYDALASGHVPDFFTIYKNSIYYGIFWVFAIFLLLFLAYSRLTEHGIRKHTLVSSPHGLAFEEVMEKYAVTEHHVRFFLDYRVTDLPVHRGSARQPMTAIDLLLYTGAIQHVSIDSKEGGDPKLAVNNSVLRNWFIDKFGPANPFQAYARNSLSQAGAIHQAVDELRWDTVLILYPAIRRIFAFHVEDEDDGYFHERDEAEKFINAVWIELNSFKKIFGDAITLGYADEADRSEREARYAQSCGKPLPENFNSDPVTDTQAKSDYRLIYEEGVRERENKDSSRKPSENDDLDRFFSKGKPSKKKKPESLLFFGEALAQRGPKLEVVANARAGLKKILTRHLGAQLDGNEKYPAYMDPKTKTVVYAAKLNTLEEKAFNQKAMMRISRVVEIISEIILNHHYEFSMVGAALDKARETGIMPPNQFRYLRFCEESQSLWWFVQNLGMPSAYPENAAHYEHYQAEKLTGVALSRPYIEAAITGVVQEAEKYLTPDNIRKLMNVLGAGAFVDLARARDQARRESVKGVSVKGIRDAMAGVAHGNIVEGLSGYLSGQSDGASAKSGNTNVDASLDQYKQVSEKQISDRHAAAQQAQEEADRKIKEASIKEASGGSPQQSGEPEQPRGVEIKTDLNNLAEGMAAQLSIPQADALAKIMPNTIRQAKQRDRQMRAGQSGDDKRVRSGEDKSAEGITGPDQVARVVSEGLTVGGKNVADKNNTSGADEGDLD